MVCACAIFARSFDHFGALAFMLTIQANPAVFVVLDPLKALAGGDLIVEVKAPEDSMPPSAVVTFQ